MYCNVFGGSGYGFGRMYGGPNFFMMIPMIVLLLIIVYLIYKAFSNKQLASVVSPPGSSSKAMSILNERLAKGEITEEEYKSIKDQIDK